MRPKCNICEKACRKNQKCLPCVLCKNLVHHKCSALTVTDIHKHTSLNLPYYCKKCNDDVFPYSGEENSDLFLDPTPNNNVFECGSTLDPEHLIYESQ